MSGDSSVDSALEGAIAAVAERADGACQTGRDGAAGEPAVHAGKAGKHADRAVKAAAQAAARTAKAQAKTAGKAAKQDRRTAKTVSKLRRAEAKAQQAAAEAAAAAATKAATGPARLVDRLTDPKIAKRALSVGKVLAPVLAPYAIKAAAGARGVLDQRRARLLGVSVEEVAAFRGPTGAIGARISGLQRSIDELAARKGNELQVTRFADVSRTRLGDLTSAVQASASMPRAGRAKVLRAVGRELDRISADLMTHLIGQPAP